MQKLKTKKHSEQTALRLGTGNLVVVADWIEEHLYAAHRGAFIEDGRLIVFDNGGIKHPREVAELEVALAWLRENDYMVEGLGTSSDCFTWVVVAAAKSEEDIDHIEEMLWEAWRTVTDAEDDASWRFYCGVQYSEAQSTIEGRPPLPKRVLKELYRKAK